MNRREMLSSVAGLPSVMFLDGRAEDHEKIKGVGVLRYPEMEYQMVDGTKRFAKDFARDIAENIRQGSIVGLPSTRDENGNYLWDFKIEGGDPGQVKIERQG